VFRLIARNIQRQADTNSYMVDNRGKTDAQMNAFYPSTASEVNLGQNYQTWYRYYANPDNYIDTETWSGVTYTVKVNGADVEKPAFDVEWLLRYYTEDSVEAFRDALAGIDWQLNKLQQQQVDGKNGSRYAEDTICAIVNDAINGNDDLGISGLVPKTYKFYFYYGLPDNNGLYLHIDDYESNGLEMKYHFGQTFVSPALTPDANLSSGLTFYGWFTKLNDSTHCVSSAANRYVVELPIDEVLLEEWAGEDLAEVSTEDGEVYKVSLYGGYVNNVTLEIELGENGYAKYTPVDQKGNVKSEVEVSVSAKPTFGYGSTLTFTEMARTGYTFASWNFTKGANNFESTMVGNVYTYGYFTGSDKTNDVLTAVWTPNTYTVTFNKNAEDATGTMAPQTFTYDVEQNLTANAYERTGYYFDGWSTNANGTGTVYTDGQSVKNLATNGSFDLYAIWVNANYVLTFTIGEDDEWQGWPGTVEDTAAQQKTVTHGAKYGAEDANGYTWPNKPVRPVVVAEDYEIHAQFKGWYTAAEGGTPVTAATDFTATGDQTLYAQFDTVVVENVKIKLEDYIKYLDANHYTEESMQAVDEVLKSILDKDGEVTQADLDALNGAYESLVPAAAANGGDVMNPEVNVYENKAALQKAIESGEFTGDASYMLRDDVGEVNFVYPGKCYYTFYCYTNSATPAIMINAKDVAGTGSASKRVSYPLTFDMQQASGVVNNGWMNYTYDDPTDNTTGRKAEYDMQYSEVENEYSGLKYFGKNYEGTNYSFYEQTPYIILKPQFVEQGGRQFALYTFKVNDDSNSKLLANEISLAGAELYGEYANGVEITTDYEAVTPVDAVTIFVEYRNTMSEGRSDAAGQVVDANGVGTYSDTGALEVYNKFHENGYQNNVWVNVDYLYRNSGGVDNNDFITPLFLKNGSYDLYVANDPVYGQTDVGSFYYLMKSTDAATTAYWNAYDDHLAKNPGDYAGARIAGATAGLKPMKNQVIADMKNEAIRAKMNSTWTQAAEVQNGDYIYWPYTGSTKWSTQFYAPARTREDTLVYVHIYDRFGNHYTNILQRDLQDTQAATANTLARGEVVINELGGSGVADVTIYELNTQKKVSVAGMTDGQEWNVVNNQFTITGLPQGNNDYKYTMKITDKAGGVQTFNFQARSDGSVLVTVNDENMGGAYAAAAAAPQAGTQGSDPVNGVGIGEIEEAALTTLAIEEVQPDEIAVDVIGEAAVNGGHAEDDEEYRPDVYTFTVNGTYVVNLFADTARDYEVTLKSTVGGTLKAYVNGQYAAPQAGKIRVPAGSQVQIRLTSKTGYELEGLTMEYPDGRVADLVGAYNAEINDDVTIKAVFVETASLLTVTVENGAVSGRQELKVKPYSRVTAVAEAAPEGKVFAYWAQDGADDVPVSYDEVYTFIVTSDADLKAIYADETAAQTAGIAMDAAADTHVTLVNGRYSLAYTGKITLPEGAQIEEFGLLLTNQSGSDCTAQNFVIGGKVNGVNVAKIAGQTLTEEGQCRINVNNVAAGQTRTGRLYLTVRLADGSTQTIYSNTWSELNTPAAYPPYTPGPRASRPGAFCVCPGSNPGQDTI
jgi:hypothetical protein